MSPTAGLDVLGEIENFFPFRDSNPDPSSTQPIHYTGYSVLDADLNRQRCKIEYGVRYEGGV